MSDVEPSAPADPARLTGADEPTAALDLVPHEALVATVPEPVAPQPVAPMYTAAPAPPGQAEPVTCPECGTSAVVTLNRRDAADFCRNCDFPLFWTPSAILREAGSAAADASLRRLPGTVGRATLASFGCPHCAEPNPLSAQACVRCGLPLHVTAPPPPPPTVLAPPPVAVAPPERRIPWWVWAFLGFVLVAATVLIVLYVNGTIG
jgi:hypothetical protein